MVRSPALVARMVLTLGAVLLVDLLFVGAAASLLWPWVSALDGPSRPLLAALAAAVALALVAWAQLRYARRQLLAAVDADPATAETHPELHARLTRLATAADCPTPSLAVVDSEVPNSMAVGGPRSATVVVSEGLLDALDDDELDAVLAHELAHVKNRDAAVLTLASSLPAWAADESSPLAGRRAVAALAFLMLSLLGAAALDLPGAGPGPVVAAAALIGLSLLFGEAVLGVLAAPVLALARRLSRDRELVADRAAARLTGDPAALAGALTTLADAPEPPDDDARVTDAGRRTAVRGLCLLPHGFDPGADDWLAPRAHPPVERRVEGLQAVAADQEG